MAKPAKGGAGDSKQGLIITLVFFVLLSIGLGVGTYYGFAGQKDLEDKAKKADGEKKSMQSDRDWYKFQALMARAYIGAPLTKNEEADLPTLRGTYESGGLGKESGGVEEVAKMTKPLDENPLVGWDQTTKRVRGSLLGLVQKLSTDLDAARNNINTLNTQAAAARQEADRRRDAYQQQLANYKKENDDLNAKLLEFEKSKSKEFVDLVTKNDDLQKAIDELTKKFNNAKDDWEKQDKTWKNTVLQKDEKYQKLEQQVPKDDALAHETPRGKILNLDRRGDYAFINLGSSDRVKPQLTFSVFGPNAAGKAEGKARKARLEVIDVLDAHLSRAKVVDVSDPNRNPVVSGDLLFNPAWSPSLKQHIAIAGLIDLTGDGTDSSEEFVRNLQKQNIVVDAFLDLKSMQLRGKLGFNTSYLVVGEMPNDDVTNPLKENDPRSQRAREVQVKLSEIQAEAIKYGITVVPARRFMALIGYQIPKSVVPPDYTIRGPRPAKPAGETGDKKPDAEPAKKDEAKEDKGKGR